MTNFTKNEEEPFHPKIPPIVTSPKAPKESHLANLTAKESESVNHLFLGDVGKIFGQLKPQGTRYEICTGLWYV